MLLFVSFAKRRRAADYSSLVVGMSAGLYVIACFVCREKESSRLVVSDETGNSVLVLMDTFCLEQVGKVQYTHRIRMET